MIQRIINRGFKDQDREIELTGLDLFTSGNVNGAGKSAVLESFKLALLGEIPGKAKTLDDIMQFTSRPEMSVRIVAETPASPEGRRGAVLATAERRFLREAERGERRPVLINQSVRRYEEGDRWIRETLGAVSLGFEPHEFLSLTDRKKRQWIISHSPESLELRKEILAALLFGRLAEAHFGRGLAREQALSLGMENLDDLWGARDDVSPKPELARRFMEVLTGAVKRQDEALAERMRAAMDKAFARWDGSLSAEENIAAMLEGLKAEALRLKTAARERAGAISCAAPFAVSGSLADAEMQNCRNAVRSLDRHIEDLGARVERCRMRFAEKRKREERMCFLQESAGSLAERTRADRAAEIRGKIGELQARIADGRALREKLDELDAETGERSEAFRRQEFRRAAAGGDLKLKRGKLDSLQAAGRGGFRCPLAPEIRCDTNMEPYRSLLAREVELAGKNEAAERAALDAARERLRDCAERARGLKDRAQRQIRANEAARREIRFLEEALAREEKEMAETRGLLKGRREEAERLGSEAHAVACIETTEDMEILLAEKQKLEADKKAAEEKLARLLREQGREEAVRELIRGKEALEMELKEISLLADFLGPRGIQGEMAARVAGALEREINETLKLIDGRFDFTVDLRGAEFLMGWKRDGKVIPFTTINSAHFILFVVPFLTVLLGRMARFRERQGLPTLKALCVEAESLTPDNLVALLRGLSVMKSKGYVDNVLVAHYVSLRDPDKLSGFTEHVLVENAVCV